MTKAIKIIYHADCFDGCCAAAVAKLKFGDKAEYIPAHYNKPFTDLHNSSIIMLDIAYDPVAMRKLLDQGNSITVIDHHMDNVAKIRNLPITLVYDAKESGASLAWKTLFADISLPLAVLHARDYDLHLHDNEFTKYFMANLSLQPMTPDSYLPILKLEGDDYLSFVETGLTIHNYKMSLVASVCKQAADIKMGGYEGKLVNAPYDLRTETGAYLVETQKAAFVLVWSENNSGDIRISIRSNENGAALKLANFLGGGGHPDAAGLVMERAKFNRLNNALRQQQKLVHANTGLKMHA